MPRFPVPFPRHIVKTVVSPLDLIIDGDLNIPQVVSALLGNVVCDRYKIEQNEGYIDSLAMDYALDEGRSFTSTKKMIKDKLEKEMYETNMFQLRKMIIISLTNVYRGELTQEFIAKMLGCTQASVATHLNRIKIKLNNKKVYDQLNKIKKDRYYYNSVSIERKICIGTMSTD